MYHVITKLFPKLLTSPGGGMAPDLLMAEVEKDLADWRAARNSTDMMETIKGLDQVRRSERVEERSSRESCQNLLAVKATGLRTTSSI